MENQEQNQQPKGLEESDSRDSAGRNNQNQPNRDTGIDGVNPHKEDPQWPDESPPSGGLVDREIGEGSEDLNDADSDDDDF